MYGSVRVRVRLRREGLGLEQFFERRSGDRTRVDGSCDFEKVPPDQLCPGAEGLGLGLGSELGLGVRVRRILICSGFEPH